MKPSIMVNWAPSLAGLVLAGLSAIEGIETGDWKDYAVAFAIAALGFVTRQWNKTSEESGAK